MDWTMLIMIVAVVIICFFVIRHLRKNVSSSAVMWRMNASSGGTFWITCMNIFSWILFAVIIIAGIVTASVLRALQAGLGGSAGATPFFIVLVSVILAFLTVAIMMVFLNMAHNVGKSSHSIEAIEEMLKNKSEANSTPMAFCINCGYRVAEGMYCSRCGTKSGVMPPLQ